MVYNLDEHSNWILGGIASVVGTLAAAVATLWKMNESKNSKAIDDLRNQVNECTEDREKIRGECTDLRVRIAKLESHLGSE